MRNASITACLAIGLAVAASPASAGMLSKFGGLAVAGFAAKKGADACLQNPACAARLTQGAGRLAERGTAACARNPRCAEGLDRTARSLSGFLARGGY